MDINVVINIGSIALGGSSVGVSIYLIKVYRRDLKAALRREPVKAHPLWDNGEKDTVRKALSIFADASEEFRGRIGRAETALKFTKLDDDKLEERLNMLEQKFETFLRQRS